MSEPNRFTALLAAVRELERLERASIEAARRRSALAPGSSRASVTTANAKWRVKSEARDLAFVRATDEALEAFPTLSEDEATR